MWAVVGENTEVRGTRGPGTDKRQLNNEELHNLNIGRICSTHGENDKLDGTFL